MAQWLSWLERRPVTAEVVSSSLIWVVSGVLAQLGEHLPYKQGVTGSSPVGPIWTLKTNIFSSAMIHRNAAQMSFGHLLQSLSRHESESPPDPASKLPDQSSFRLRVAQ